MKEHRIQRRHLFNFIRENISEPRDVQKEKIQKNIFDQLRDKWSTSECDKVYESVSRSVSKFCSTLFQKWDQCHRKLNTFLSRYDGWLDEEISFKVDEETGIKKKIGRPSTSFEESSARTKRLKTENLRAEHTTAELLYAAAMKLREDGLRECANFVQTISENANEACEVIETANKIKTTEFPKKLSSEEGVSLILETDLGKAQYNYLRLIAKDHYADIFPSYDDILMAKKNAYPPPGSIKVTEKNAEVELQSILDHDSVRIIKYLEHNGQIGFRDFTQSDLQFLHKWGTDGSSGHSVYKQNFKDEFTNDSSILFTAMVPLQLEAIDPSGKSIILWTNASPSSTRFCKPLRIQMIKESKESLLAEETHFSEQIATLKPSEVKLDSGDSIKIWHKLKMTMIDGKTRNILTNTSSMATCCACGATPSRMSSSISLKKTVNVSSFKYGLSVLHTRIRMLECVLHVSYKLEVKKWSCKEELYKERKLKIQDAIKKELGILVDVVKQGMGTTNDGNTARRFFEHADEISSITGFDLDLLERFRTIQIALSSGIQICVEKFRVYALETAKRFEDVYPWYHMPASVHFILIHGADVMQTLELPMGLYSEEALEARNKHIRSFREYRTRKISREATMSDLFNRLLLSGDILFTLSRTRALKVKEHSLPESVKQLLDCGT